MSMKKIFIIGIGAGDPDHVTMQAIKALNRVNVFFVFDKGAETAELVEIRREICARYITDNPYRIVEIESPKRDASAGYGAGVEAWHRARSQLAASAISRELPEGRSGAFLVWGDPALYDSTLRILQHILIDDPDAFEIEVIPGITSVQVLAARHQIPLNGIGEPIHITTGRRLSGEIPLDSGNVVVMLDDGSGLKKFVDDNAEIYWGAYMGTPDEILMAGKFKDVAPDILKIRQREKMRKGWIMDTYLLRRHKPQ